MKSVWSLLQIPNYSQPVDTVPVTVMEEIWALNMANHFFELHQYRGWTALSAQNHESGVYVGRAREGSYDQPEQFLRAKPDPDQEWLSDPAAVREAVLAAFKEFVDKRQPVPAG